MTYSFHLPHYFTYHLRREVKELYAATAIMDIASSAMLIFEPIYLYSQLGLSLVQILLFFAAVYAWYVVLLPVGGIVASKLGYKHSIIYSMPFQLLYWACLFFAGRFSILLVLAPLMYAISKSLYWPAFHAIVAQFANRAQVAREFSALSAIIQAAQIFGPLAGGLIAQATSGEGLLIVAGGIYTLALIPLVKHVEVNYKRWFSFRKVLEFYRSYPKHMLAYFGFGEELLALSVWPIVIFLAVAGYGATGFLATVASGVSVLFSLYIGKKTEGKSKLSLLKLGALLTALGWMVRPFTLSAGALLGVDSAARITKNLYFIPLCTVTYERAESRDILPYVVFFEQSLAFGKLLFALLAMALFAITLSYPVLYILGALSSLLFFFI